MNIESEATYAEECSGYVARFEAIIDNLRRDSSPGTAFEGPEITFDAMAVKVSSIGENLAIVRARHSLRHEAHEYEVDCAHEGVLKVRLLDPDHPDNILKEVDAPKDDTGIRAWRDAYALLFRYDNRLLMSGSGTGQPHP